MIFPFAPNSTLIPHGDPHRESDRVFVSPTTGVQIKVLFIYGDTSIARIF